MLILSSILKYTNKKKVDFYRLSLMIDDIVQASWLIRNQINHDKFNRILEYTCLWFTSLSFSLSLLFRTSSLEGIESNAFRTDVAESYAIESLTRSTLATLTKQLLAWAGPSCNISKISPLLDVFASIRRYLHDGELLILFHVARF